MVYTYVLRSSKDLNLYTGSTKDLRKRFKYHNSKQKRGPFELIYYEACVNEHDARAREKYLKSGRGKYYLRKRLDRFLNGTG